MSTDSRTSPLIETVPLRRLRPMLSLVTLFSVAVSRLASAQADLSRVDSIVTEMLADQGIPGASLYIGTLNGRPR